MVEIAFFAVNFLFELSLYLRQRIEPYNNPIVWFVKATAFQVDVIETVFVAAGNWFCTS